MGKIVSIEEIDEGHALFDRLLESKEVMIS